mgnify:CR=1 FL=1|tara:strand:+ start:377 stop:616 length:240 start_codon:yes stop_codon:yes gene_type:complete
MSAEHLKEIYNKAGLTPAEQKQMPGFIASRSDELFYESSQFEKLYEYLAFTIAVMPYENARGKRATPDDWILEFLEGWQ